MAGLWKNIVLEIDLTSATDPIADQYLELLQGFIRLHPKLIKPEQASQFKKQMEKLRKSGLIDPEDRPLLFRVFAILNHSEMPPTMGELSSELGIPLSSTTRIVDLLVSNDLVQRLHDPADRRVVRIRMSEDGQRFARIATEFLRDRIVSLLDNFDPDEQKQLLQLMTKLLRSLEAEYNQQALDLRIPAARINESGAGRDQGSVPLKG